MILLLLVALCAAGVRADCDACVDGWCHSRQSLIEGSYVTKLLAIDQIHNTLYVEMNTNQYVNAYSLDDFQLKMMYPFKTSAIAVDQDTQDLYIADYNKTIYKFEYGNSNTPTASYISNFLPDQDVMFYKNHLYYSGQYDKRLSYIENMNRKRYFDSVRNYIITDLIVQTSNMIYFVAYEQLLLFTNNTVYTLMNEGYTLSVDKYSYVYLGDAKVKAIYKINELNEPEEYAAYTTGLVDKFVFDRDNNIVFHDAEDGSIATWKKGDKMCSMHAPHAMYQIVENVEVQEDVNTEELERE